tara:strand:- start:229 stop:411 length:183 start_codon:yes stop_codon:yes gene_type:complete
MVQQNDKKSFKEFVNADELNLLSENYENFILKFRRYYRTGQKQTFRQWLNIVGELLDELV